MHTDGNVEIAMFWVTNIRIWTADFVVRMSALCSKWGDGGSKPWDVHFLYKPQSRNYYHTLLMIWNGAAVSAFTLTPNINRPPLQWQVTGEGQRYITMWKDRKSRSVTGWINNSDCRISRADFYEASEDNVTPERKHSTVSFMYWKEKVGLCGWMS